MASYTPVTLSGDNLGQRHWYLNSLVQKTIESEVSVLDFDALEEKSPVDRLFKINLAVQLKNKAYIISNLKDIDMLYVSKALKAKWLLEHHDIVNPKHLEEVLFPEMITPAVGKMKHWLHINLRDPKVCQEFYEYYMDIFYDFAIKFLSHCSSDFILKEVPHILTKITTHHLKVLCENCPKVAKIYFDSLSTDEDVVTRYLEQEHAYYNCAKLILKSDANVFLDITEKYFNLSSFSRLSPSATDYILRYHKNRFTNKLELYIAYFLHIPTLASLLSVEECQEVVIKLAQAKYLHYWFEYKVVEPLIKRLSPDKRAAFKKRVFVEKDVGVQVDEWTYATPASPTYSNFSPHVFDDHEFEPVCSSMDFRSMLKKRKFSRYRREYDVESCMPSKSDLDRLFDEFRFIGFERALHDLGLRLGAAGSADRRRDMFLVLVSKSGGRSDAVSALLRLAARHTNEPAHTRAAVLRSLVKRANVWRLPADVWQHLLDFGHGLGLDGGTSEAPCREGFHAVVIRQLLAGECQPQVLNVFLDDFSTLAEYSLTVDERACVAVCLQKILVAAATDVKPEVAAKHLDQLLNVLDIYHIRIEPESPTVKAVMALALRDTEVALPLLKRLYNARVARRDLYQVNLNFRQNEAALLNALRHDPSVLGINQVVKILGTGKSYDRFISKLVIYFDEKEGIATILRAALKEKITQEYNVKLVRPLATLFGKDLEMELRDLDAAGSERVKFAAALRACAHRARPVDSIAKWGWRKAGVKAIATSAMRCREVERTELIRALATERRTVRVALVLSMRCKKDLMLDTFQSTAEFRPAVALRSALLYFRLQGAQTDPRVWDIVKPLMSSVDLASRKYLCRLLKHNDWIPSTIKPDYCATLYLVRKKTLTSCDFLLRELTKLLPEVSTESIENILLDMLNTTDEAMPVLSFPAIFIRYLMLSRDNEDLTRRFDKIGNRFLARLDALRCENDAYFPERLNQIMESLKYNAAFLDTKYTSCLLVIEKILFWMQNFMPKGENFKRYVPVHLTMLYFKAVRQSMKQIPEVFGDPKRKLSEGVEAVGFFFGRYIAKEVAELVRSYFDSIIELYTGPLVDYLGDYFMSRSVKAKFLGFVLKGMLAEEGSQRRMAVTVLRDYRCYIDEYKKKEIEELMIQDKTVEFFTYAELLTQYNGF